MPQVHTHVKIEVVKGKMPNEKSIYVHAMQPDGQIGAECRTIEEFEGVVRAIESELRDLRGEVVEHFKRLRD